MLIEHLLVDFDDVLRPDSDKAAISSLCLPINEHLAKLSDQPDRELNQPSLRVVVPNCVVEFGHRVLMQLRSRGNDRDDLRDVGLARLRLRQSEHLDDRVNVPFLIWRKLLTDLTNLVRQLALEVRLRIDQVIRELFDDGLDIGAVRDLIYQVERLLLDLHILVL